MKRITLLAAVMTAAAAVLSAQGQTVFRAGAQTVPIYTTVLDKAGRLVPDLLEEHFEVTDDGKPAPLVVFKSDVQPITVVVMLDTSGSMTLNLGFLKVAAEQFVLRLLPTDRARIGSFSDQIFISPTFTNNRDDLVRYLHTEIRFGNPTFLWDAVDRSMDAMAKEQGRRVVLIFTDGDDQRSVKTNFDGVLARAQAEDFMIYAIGLQSQILGTVTRPDRALKKLAEDTGGGYFELKQTADLNATFTRVADELHRQYSLGIKATLDGKLHKLDVKVKVPGMTARARKTYLGAKSDGPAPLLVRPFASR